MVLNIATFFVRTEKVSNLVAALHLTPTAVGAAVGGLVAGKIIQRTRHYKKLALIGLCFSTLGFVLMTFRWHGRINTWEAIYILFPALGYGIVNSTQFIALMLDAPQEHASMFTSLFLLSQQVGTMVGISVSAALLQRVFRLGLVSRLGSSPQSNGVS